MDENLVGYLLDALDADARREVEDYVRSQPEARQRLEVLRQGLQPLAADREAIEPPPGLVGRTLARLPRPQPRELLPMPVPLARVGPGNWWRRGDVLVAAGLLLCIVGLGGPALYRARSHYHGRQECANNLRVLHQSLVNYAQHHGENFPKVEETSRRDMAGVFVPLLHDAGVLPEQASTRCPSNGRPALQRLSLGELDALPPEEFPRHAARLAGCYAYTLGYRDAQGRLQGYRSDDGDGHPLLADRPLLNDSRGNSPNHAGQNVLYIGGHVRFARQPTAGVGNDHIFVNRLHQVAAGLDKDDAVLGTSADHP